VQLSFVLKAEQKQPLSVDTPPVDHEVSELSVLHIFLFSSESEASILSIGAFFKKLISSSGAEKSQVAISSSCFMPDMLHMTLSPNRREFVT
jgi:hypothetical protein